MPVDDSLLIPQTLLVQQATGPVVEVPLEAYVKGVVSTCLGLPVPPEALKAVAIVARSTAAVIRSHGRDGFDLCATEHCQAWRPGTRYPEADGAVDDTTGQVLTVGGCIVLAPMFDHCDGHTRPGKDALAGTLGHCCSTACPCGHSSLSGHGVGLCRQGALVLARQGATAERILHHYYPTVQVAQAKPAPRAGLRQSLIVGRSVDAIGRPRPGLRLMLVGPGGTYQATSQSDGRFWFAGVPAGQWTLRIKGRSVYCGDLHTDGRNTVDAQLVLPDAPRFSAQVVPLSQHRLLAGTVGCAGVPVIITDSSGCEQVVVSGSAPDFDPGGFAVPLPPAGLCTVRIFDQTFNLEIGDGGLWVSLAVGNGSG